ncbi:MAG: alpha/beta fold hydrolase [Acidimicrobiia bacterium]
MSLARPPQKMGAGPVSIVGRFLLTLVVVAILGILGWAIVVSGSIDDNENLDRNLVAPGSIIAIPGRTDVHIRTAGSGDPVLLIHDFDLAGGYQWSAMQEPLAGHRLLMPDLVDFGFSARPGQTGRLHTVVGQAETMLALLDELGIRNVSVVGAGLGGSIAAQMAALAPDVVDRLVLIAPEIYGPEPTWESTLYRLPTVGDAMTYTFIGAGAQAETRYVAGCPTGGYCPSAETRATRASAAKVSGTTDSLTALFNTPLASTLPDGLSAIEAPTLILWGDGDTVTPLNQGEQLAVAVAGSELLVVPGAGHRPHLEDPETTAGFIAQFLG